MKKLAILLPGFLDSKDYEHLVKLDIELKNLGYYTIRIQPTGTWTNSSDASKYSMTRYLSDVEKEINKHNNPNDILLAGHSLGGSIALIYASRHSNISTAIGIMSPTTYIRDENLEKMNNWKKDGSKTSTRDLPNDRNKNREFVLPYSFIKDAEQYDVAKEIPEFKGNLLLVAGELDDCVVPQQLKDIYKAANQPKELKIIDGIGHDYRHNEKEIQIVNKEIIRFINKHS